MSQAPLEFRALGAIALDQFQKAADAHDLGRVITTEVLGGANGNNVGWFASNNIEYAAVYDSADNLVCESLTVGGTPTWVRHHEYGCFDGR